MCHCYEQDRRSDEWIADLEKIIMHLVKYYQRIQYDFEKPLHTILPTTIPKEYQIFVLLLERNIAENYVSKVRQPPKMRHR
jgi:hypothetical protein